MTTLNNILDNFKDFKIDIKGVGSFVKINGVDVVAIKDCKEYIPIGIEDCTGGYIRTSGIKTLTVLEDISGCGNVQLYEVIEELNIVIATDEYTIDSVCESVLSRIKDVKRIITNKRTIEQEEFIKTDMELLKIVFDYKYNYIKNCKDELECVC